MKSLALSASTGLSRPWQRFGSFLLLSRAPSGAMGFQPKLLGCRMAAGPVALPRSASSRSPVTRGMWDAAPTSHSCCPVVWVRPVSQGRGFSSRSEWACKGRAGVWEGRHRSSSDCFKFSVLPEQLSSGLSHSPGLGGFPSLAGLRSHHVLMQHVFIFSIQRRNCLCYHCLSP